MQTLTATKRTAIGKSSKDLKDEGSMAAVVYGPKQESIAITLSSREFDRVLKTAGESSVIDLAGLGSPMQVLIHEVDRDPVTNQPRHADFYAIEKGAKVEVAVPLTFIGESAAVKAGANLVKIMHELEIEASPADLPHDIEVDLASLAAIGDQIHVRDIKLPKGVTLKVEEDEVVALVQEVQEEKAEEAAPADLSSIEVEKKGKEEAEGEAAAAE